jgi:hypothetical protein
MKFSSRLMLACAACALGLLSAPASYAGHFNTFDDSSYETNLNPSWHEEDRTVNRTTSGMVEYPSWLMARPEHYEFLPLTSNWDAQNKHPQQWKGQDWDPSKWDGKLWTPEIAVHKFYEGRIFDRQYMRGKIPVLVVGPTFYKLSDLDQRRTLKLLSDYTGIFGKGYEMMELRDWHSKKVVGAYTPRGMYLN